MVIFTLCYLEECYLIDYWKCVQTCIQSGFSAKQTLSDEHRRFTGEKGNQMVQGEPQTVGKM